MTSLPNSHVITTRESIGALIALPFQAVSKFLVYLAVYSGRAARLDQLNNSTDAELALRGLTRAEAARRILGAYF